MRLTIVNDDDTKTEEEVCCNNHSEMRLHISKVLSNWYDQILSVDDEDDLLFSQRMHFRYACKSRLNWHKDESIEKMHDTLFDKEFMLRSVDNNIDLQMKMEASANFSEIDHTVCVFLNVLQEITMMKQQEYIEKLVRSIEKMK
tara:strand:- start:465 stop:896 length:432 start_codon:yes stop_codon:yes gene_type:complete